MSHEQIEDFARIGVPRECLFFVPFGVDVDFYASVGDSDEEEFVVSVGRDLGRDYGTLLEAAKESDHPFVIVAAHKNLPGDMPLPPNVTVRHNLPLAEVRDLYARARVVVIASKDAEVSEGTDCSGQTVILDALAAGRPVVATERPWIKEYFTPSEELLVVPPHNPRALAAAIELLWQDRGEREHLAHAGRAKVRVAYTTKTLAMALERVVFTEKRDSTDEDGRVV